MTAKFFLGCVILLGLFTRGYELRERFIFNHDNDLSAWIVKDLIIDRHLRLIGQETSSQGIFIGPLFYYLLVPLYAFSGMSPEATLFYPIFIGLFSVFSAYYVFYKLWGQAPAVLGSLIYASSYAISSVEREVVPTTPVFLWTIWALYAFHLILAGNKRGLWLLSVLGGLVWHINLALGLLVVTLFLALIKNLRRFKLRDFALPAIIGLLISSPLMVFEIRHNFIQTRALTQTFNSKPEAVPRTVFEKTVHVTSIAAKNANWIFWDRPQSVPQNLLPGLLALGFAYVCLKSRGQRPYAILFLAWTVILVYFFIRHPINISEYYLNGLTIIWISIAAIILSRLGVTGKILVSIIVILNVFRLLQSSPDAGGFIYRQALVDFIASDTTARSYPCFSVSYMVQPGYDLGYRFLFYRRGLHVNKPDSGAPVYTIVFPHTKANKLDKTFGSLGLVLPEYDRYTTAGVQKSCSGKNSNLTDPMFGFTK